MKKRLDFIDALRGFAVFGVLVVHTFNPIAGKLPKVFSNLVSNGARGVQLFFVISAFTLFLSLDNKKQEKKPIRNFFIRRFFRIAPLFWLAMVAYLLINGTGPRYWLGDVRFISNWNIAATAFFVNGWYPYWLNSVLGINWTVAIEMSFYLLVPFLYKKVTNIYDAVLLTIFSGSVLVFLNPFMLDHNPIGSPELWRNFVDLWLPNQFPVFCLGIVLYFLLKEEAPDKIYTNKTYVLKLLVTGLIFFLGLIVYNNAPLINPYGYFFVILAFTLAKFPFKIFVNKFWIYLGKISYSAYLTHLIALMIVGNFFKNHFKLGVHHDSHLILSTGIIFFGTLILTMIISTFTYHLIERPGVIFGNKIIDNLENGKDIFIIKIFNKIKWRRNISNLEAETW